MMVLILLVLIIEIFTPSNDPSLAEATEVEMAYNNIYEMVSEDNVGTCAPCDQILGQHEPRSDQQLQKH